MKDHPLPVGLIDPVRRHVGRPRQQSAALCFDAKTGDAYAGDALLACACALDYSILATGWTGRC